MSVIHKTALNVGSVTRVESPVRPLSVGLDALGVPCVWYWAAEHSKERNSWDVEVLGTGVADRERDEIGEFLGTVAEGGFIAHVFVR